MSNTRFFKNPFNDDGPVEISPDVVKGRTLTCIDHILKNLEASRRNSDGGLYVGTAGVAYAFYYLAKCGFFPSQKKKFLEAASSYINAALQYCEKNHQTKKRQVSFLLEDGGVFAVAALISSALGDQQRCLKYVEAYRGLETACEPLTFLENGSDELFVGRAGYLLGVLLLQRDLEVRILTDEQTDRICQRIVESGRKYRSRLNIDIDSPLMYAYHGTIYLGAGHGIAGILQVLLSFPNFLARHPDSCQAVKKSVDFLLHACLKDGNIPTDLEGALYPGHEKMLVHWCHGASGVIYTFARAYLVFGRDEKYLHACRTLAEVVWQKGLLKKGPGICHGVAGSGYVFLLMYRLTGEEKYLYRAERFSSFIFTELFNEGARTPDHPFSLYEGLAGTVCFLNDLLQPKNAEFPFSDVILN